MRVTPIHFNTRETLNLSHADKIQFTSATVQEMMRQMLRKKEKKKKKRKKDYAP